MVDCRLQFVGSPAFRPTRYGLSFRREDMMELKMPSQEQVYWGLRAMTTVSLADGAGWPIKL